MTENVIRCVVPELVSVAESVAVPVSPLRDTPKLSDTVTVRPRVLSDFVGDSDRLLHDNVGVRVSVPNEPVAPLVAVARVILPLCVDEYVSVLDWLCWADIVSDPDSVPFVGVATSLAETDGDEVAVVLCMVDNELCETVSEGPVRLVVVVTDALWLVVHVGAFVNDALHVGSRVPVRDPFAVLLHEPPSTLGEREYETERFTWLDDVVGDLAVPVADMVALTVPLFDAFLMYVVPITVLSCALGRAPTLTAFDIATYSAAVVERL